MHVHAHTHTQTNTTSMEGERGKGEFTLKPAVSTNEVKADFSLLLSCSNYRSGDLSYMLCHRQK